MLNIAVVVKRVSNSDYSGYVIGKLEYTTPDGQLFPCTYTRREGDTDTTDTWARMRHELPDASWDDVEIGDYISG